MSYTGRYSSTYTPDTAFPPGPLNLQADMYLGGAWTPVTGYVYQRDSGAPVTITRGRPDETAQAAASGASFQLNNRDGRFSPRNPLGPYYGQIGRNTPARFSVPEGGTYLRLEDGAYDGTAYSASATKCASVGTTAMQAVSGLDIRIDVKLTSYTRSVLAAQYTSTGSQRMWALVLHRDGTIGLWWSTDGTFANTTQSTSALPIPLGRTALRVTLALNSGTVTYYTGPAGGADGSTWTQLGAAATFASTSVFAGTAELGIARAGGVNFDDSTYFPMNGSVYEFELRTAIAGTVAAHPVFSAQTAGLGSFQDAQSNIWIMYGAGELSARKYRFCGELAALPQRWDSSGADVWADTAAGGLLRRLGQGTSPVDSAFKRAILAKSGTLAPVAYWPAEDLAGSASIGSATGGQAMSLAGSPQLASDSAYACSNALPQWASGAGTGVVPYYTGAGSIVVRFLLHVTSSPPDGTVLLRALCSHTVREFTLRWNVGGNLSLSGWDGSGANLFNSGPIIPALGSSLWWVSMELTPSGSNITWALSVLQVGQSTGFTATNTFAGTIGNVLEIQVNPNQATGSVTMGHISVQADFAPMFADFSPLVAWNGENAGNRFARLCQENGIPVRIIGAPGVTANMGPQTPQTLVSLLQECEAADMGLMFEPRQALALGYRTLASMTSQAAAAALDYAQAHLGDGQTGLEPTDDDQFTRNDWTVSRASGSSFRVALSDGSPMSVSEPPTGAGDYANSATVNVLADSQLYDIGGWLLNLGTFNGPRYPVIPLNLARTALASLYYTVQDVSDGDMITIANPPAWLPPGTVRQLVYGFTEVLGGPHHTISWQCVPEQPYEVVILDDTTLGHVDTDGSTLRAGIGTADLSMQVSSSGLPWTTSAADFPFDLLIGGEQVTVSSISGASSPQTFTLSARAVNGVVKTHAPGEAVSVARPVVLAIA